MLINHEDLSTFIVKALMHHKSAGTLATNE